MIFDSNGRPLVPVHQCWNDSEAEVVIGYLRAHGIEAKANSEVPHNVLPITADGLGEVLVMVKERDADHARELLASRPESVDTWDDDAQDSENS